MTKDLHEAGDNAWLKSYPDPAERKALNTIHQQGTGKETIAIISYANGYYLSCQAQKRLADECDLDVNVIDLCWIAPLPIDPLMKAIENCEAVLIVDECRKTGSLSEALVTHIIEYSQAPPRIKRVTAEDSFIPLGNAWESVLPSQERIVQAVRELAEDSSR